MPRVNIYLNDKDYATWSKIINKSAFVSVAINEKKDILPQYCKHGNVPGYCARGCQPKFMNDSIPMEFCKHNAVKGMCKRGCK